MSRLLLGIALVVVGLAMLLLVRHARANTREGWFMFNLRFAVGGAVAIVVGSFLVTVALVRSLG